MCINQNVVCFSYGEGSYTEYYLEFLKKKYGNIPQDEKPKRKKFPIIALLIFIAAIICNLIFSPVIWELLGNKDITKKPDGIYCYYVIIKNDKYGPYTLPAEIVKSDNCYTVYKIFWPNGGYIDTEEEIYLDRPTSIEDQDWRKWDATLLNNKAENVNVKETSVLEKIYVMREFWFWMAVPTVIFIIYLIWYYKFSDRKRKSD